MQHLLWIGCLASLALVGFSAWRDHRRARRTDLDAVGFMPWPLVMVMAMIVAAVLAALALKAN